MSQTHRNCVQARYASLFLVAISAVAIVGCQTPPYRRHPQRSHSPLSRPTQSCVTHGNPHSLLSPSPSDALQFGIGSDATQSTNTDQYEKPLVQSGDEVAEWYRQLRGKLRANEDGVIVEADFSYSDVTDEALASIAMFQGIKELDLTGTQVHDESLIALQQLPELQSLKLKGTRISSVGMSSLAKIPTLVLLDASNTAVTDDGLSQASQWTNLRYLSLNHTTVTDDSIPYLISVKSLKGLSLLNTSVSAEGTRMLKEALPDCLIVTRVNEGSLPSAAVNPLRPVPSQSGVAFPGFQENSDTQLLQVIELAGKQPSLAVHLASVYSSREQWHQAVQILAAAATVDPGRQPLQLALGIALARSGDLAAAKPHLIQAVGEAAANYNLGLIEYENNLRSCATHFRQAVAADPSLADAQVRLREVQQELSTLKQQRAPIHVVSSTAPASADVPLEVVPAPPVHATTFSNSWPR